MSLRRKAPRARWNRFRGTAMAEFAIVAPLFILIWAAITKFRDQCIAAQQALHESRTEAWAYATAGKCKSGFLPGSLTVAAAAEWGTFADEIAPVFYTSGGSILSGSQSVDAKISRAPRNDKSGGGIGGRTYLDCNDDLPSSDDTLLPWATPAAMKELRVQW